MKIRVPSDCKEHMLDEWEQLNSPDVLTEKRDTYGNIISSYVKKNTVVKSNKKEFTSRDRYKKQNSLHAYRKNMGFSRRYPWTGMRFYTVNYVKKRPYCDRFKATNQKSAEPLRTPAMLSDLKH
ncbi:hypothetical protein CDAR_226281 [Caerostris darwini]|uniref:Uncharacterized protein n=1 Tax=Caerostris darwini TaxID=1538125 RepID=A0AAV4ULR8_9ARAC|nr:hypothetical protein CDAR_226281 [Caerostris darwini]